MVSSCLIYAIQRHPKRHNCGFNYLRQTVKLETAERLIHGFGLMIKTHPSIFMKRTHVEKSPKCEKRGLVVTTSVCVFAMAWSWSTKKNRYTDMFDQIFVSSLLVTAWIRTKLPMNCGHFLIYCAFWVIIIPDLSTRALWQIPSQKPSSLAGRNLERNIR
jgi:hypothetical protein